MSRCNFFQFTLSLLNFLIKRILGKTTKKTDPDLKLWISRPWGPTTWGARYKKINQVTHSRNSGRGHGKGLISIFLFYSQSCPQAYRADGCRQKSLLDGATDLLAKI